MYVTAVNINITYIFLYKYISELYSFACERTCWKFSSYYKFTIKEFLKLTKGITWWYSNIVLKLDNVKYTNTLKNNLHLGDEIKRTKETKQILNNQRNVEQKTTCLSQFTNRWRRCCSNRKSLFFPQRCLAKVNPTITK